MARSEEQVYSRPPWERMMRIHQLLQNHEFPNCSSLAREFEVSTRTIRRDLDFMRDRLNLPLDYDDRRYGFFYTRPVNGFPNLPVTEAEMFALLVAHKAIAQYHGTPFEKPLQTAFSKLTGQLDQSVRFTFSGAHEVLSFRPFAPEPVDLDTFQLLTRAVREHRAIQFLYRNLGTDRTQRRHVHPYHLACVENHWYLFAYDLKREAIRTFSMGRLSQPEVLPERFTVDKKFDLNEYLSGSLSVFKGRADYEVVVEFDAWAADLVRGRRWHKSQEMVELNNGQLRLRLRLNGIEEAERWILNWGEHATVVRPRALAERIRTIAGVLQDRYTRLLQEP